MVVLISVQAILPHCGSLLCSLVMTARSPSGDIDLTALGLITLAHQNLVIQINFKPFNNFPLIDAELLELYVCIESEFDNNDFTFEGYI